MAYVNPTTRELGACEFVDDEQFCALEAVVCQLGAKECVVAKEATETPEGRRLRDLVARRFFEPEHIPGTAMVADIATKPLPRAVFLHLISILQAPPQTRGSR